MQAIFILSLALFAMAGAQGERVADIPGVETSEPLYQKEIEAKLPSLYYKFSDAYLFGLNECKEVLVNISAEDSKYDYHVSCSHLTLEARYEIEGEIGPHYVEGKGDSKIEFYNYVFVFHGDYVTTEVANGKTSINLKTYTLEVQNNGTAHYDFGNLFDGDKEKSDVVHKWFNDNSQLVEKECGKAAWEAFMGTLFNDYIARVTLQDNGLEEETRNVSKEI